MSKPLFDPNQPFASAKPEFDPNAPFTAVDENQQMGGSPPVSYVASQVSQLAPWNKISTQFPKVAGNIAEKLGGVGINPYISAAVTTPIAMAPDLLAASTAVPEATTPNVTLENLANKASASANSRWFKAAGGTLQNAKELGAHEALRLGRLARSAGYVTPLNSAESQAQLIGKDLQGSGKRLGELRALGDLYGQSPEAMKIVQAIHQDLAPKYGTGIRSGESGDLQKAIQEVLKLEPLDKLTPSEELSGFMKRDIPTEKGTFNIKTSAKGTPTTSFKNQLIGSPPTTEVPNPRYVPPTSKSAPFKTNPYEKFRAAQESPDYIPEYDLRRPTTFNEVANVATDINQFAKGQSKLLQPSGAMTDVANVISRMNNEALLKALPPIKGAEYGQNLQKYADLSKLDRMNELKSAYEVGGSRNSIVNNISNRIFHRFGYQLSATALDKIAGILKAIPQTPTINPAAGYAALAAFIDKVTTKQNAP